MSAKLYVSYPTLIKAPSKYATDYDYWIKLNKLHIKPDTATLWLSQRRWHHNPY